jgi:inhibitor of KinA sporulation pathway (predicted exonuclease)
VVAGCAFATTYVKVLMTRALDRATARMPAGVNLDAYIDDLTLSTTGSKAQVVDRLGKAHRILKQVIQEELGCEFAREKNGGGGYVC